MSKLKRYSIYNDGHGETHTETKKGKWVKAEDAKAIAKDLKSTTACLHKCNREYGRAQSDNQMLQGQWEDLYAELQKNKHKKALKIMDRMNDERENPQKDDTVSYKEKP